MHFRAATLEVSPVFYDSLDSKLSTVLLEVELVVCSCKHWHHSAEEFLWSL